MILLLGVPADAPLAMVHAELTKQGQAVVLVDQREVLKTEVDVTFCRDVAGTLQIHERVVDLGSITAVYLRSYGLDQLPVLRDLDRKGPEWLHAVNVTDTITAWTELSSSLVIN